MKKLVFTFALVTSLFAQAGLLSYEAGDQNLNNIVLNKTASVNDAEGKPTALKLDLLGAGLRNMAVAELKIKVYVAQLFSDSKSTFVRDENQALTSLITTSKTIAIKLDMLRTVSASSLVSSFKKALVANGIDPDTDLKIKEILTQIEASAEATSGKSVTLLMKLDGANSQLSYEDTAGKIVKIDGSSDMIKNILQIWLDKPADAGLASLKTQLLKAVY